MISMVCLVFFLSKVIKYLNIYIKDSLKKIEIKFINKTKDPIEGIKTYLNNELKTSLLNVENESSFSLLDINNTLF